MILHRRWECFQSSPALFRLPMSAFREALMPSPFSTRCLCVSVTAGAPVEPLMFFELRFPLWHQQDRHRCVGRSNVPGFNMLPGFMIRATSKIKPIPLGKPPREMIWSSFKCKNLSNIWKSWTPTPGLILPQGTLIFLRSPSVVTITAHYVVKERPGCGNPFQPKADGVVANRLFNSGDNPACRSADFPAAPASFCLPSWSAGFAKVTHTPLLLFILEEFFDLLVLSMINVIF